MLGLYWGYSGIIENNKETTILHWVAMMKLVRKTNPSAKQNTKKGTEQNELLSRAEE